MLIYTVSDVVFLVMILLFALLFGFVVVFNRISQWRKNKRKDPHA